MEGWKPVRLMKVVPTHLRVKIQKEEKAIYSEKNSKSGDWEELYPRVKKKPKTCKIKEMEQQLKNEINRCKDKKYNRNCTKEKERR